MFGLATVGIVSMALLVSTLDHGEPQKQQLQDVQDSQNLIAEASSIFDLNRKSEALEKSRNLMTAVSDLEKGIHEGFLSVKDTNAQLREDMSEASEAFLQLEEALAEEELNATVELKEKVNIKFKGAIVGSVKITDRIVKKSGQTLKALNPMKIEESLLFIRSNGEWLKENEIYLIEDLSLFEQLNHDFKLTSMDYAAIVQKIHSENNIVMKWMRYMKKPKYQDNTSVAKFFKYIFETQIESLNTTLEKLEKAEKLMGQLNKKMSRTVARMHSGAIEVMNSINKNKKYIKKNVGQQQGYLNSKIWEAKNVLSSDIVEQLEVEEIPDPFLDKKTRKMCGKGLMVRDAKLRDHCAEENVDDKKWFKKKASGNCKPAQIQNQTSKECVRIKQKLEGLIREANEKRQRAYENAIAKAEQLAHDSQSQDEKKNILELKDAYKQALEFEKQKMGFDNNINENDSLITQWSGMISVLNAYSQEVLHSSDSLLLVVKTVTERFKIQFMELKEMKPEDFAPNFFQGTKSSFDPEDCETEEEFEEGEDNLMFELFVTSSLDALKKVKRNSQYVLDYSRCKINNWKDYDRLKRCEKMKLPQD